MHPHIEVELSDTEPQRARSKIQPVLECRSIRKQFGQFVALADIDFSLVPGEVHALLGSNGAGKSTLVKVIAGVTQPTSGSIRLGGYTGSFRTPAESRAHGVAVVHQDLSLVPSMSVATNLGLPQAASGRIAPFSRRGSVSRAKALLGDAGLDVDPRARVEELSFGARQQIEILKALSMKVKLLVLDEPTSSLTADETDHLFSSVRELSRRGVAVIYVTHRLAEVFEIADTMTILRNGSVAYSNKIKSSSMEEAVAVIAGTPSSSDGHVVTHLRSSPDAGDPPLLQLHDVTASAVEAVCLEVHRGEIVGLCGQMGSGRTEILETVYGLRAVESGRVIVNGIPARFRRPGDAMRAGLGLVPENRHEQAVVLQHSVARNTALPRLDSLSRYGWFLRSSAARKAQHVVDRYRVRTPGPHTPMSSLSGGNQQKIVIGRLSNPQPSLLLLDEPTVGVDVGAREEIYGAIDAAVARGAGALVVSSDFAELYRMCDRFYIVERGRICGEARKTDISGEEDLHHMVQRSAATK
ncbi:ribose ABC transporter [Pseudonocardia sulfidoxydans NBRC 16205]|uniref:Ribose ABC transporter n=1 Tax=Pseudonocardia sulfidoxydans NBRC 16205 TaxID=1223511 RepID=A0A511DUU8_9PSEU|nr:sugar ABC transporter ATP-binding protein [Pseudonocardia sulfidoxydans]GEL26868.1 ribose ABC transporter [Pseudonocardia sulfidoxydans NBRC 16205]